MPPAAFWPRPGRRRGVSFCTFLAACLLTEVALGETWRGLVVEPEDRCSPYRSNDYSYPPSVEPRIVAELGKIYSPYTGQCFSSMRQTDIEHIVARSEAHDSGLCRADIATRKRFSSDLLNLTLADPKLNRHQKRAYDAAEWMPEINRCWFASRVLQVRLKYGLSINRREAEALERILSTCTTSENREIGLRHRTRPPGFPSRSLFRGSGGPTPLGRQPERKDYLPRGAPPRHCARATWASRLSVHARW